MNVIAGTEQSQLFSGSDSSASKWVKIYKGKYKYESKINNYAINLMCEGKGYEKNVVDESI